MAKKENLVWNWLTKNHPGITKTGWRDPSVVEDPRAVRDYLTTVCNISEGSADAEAEKLLKQARAEAFKEKHPLFSGWRRLKL